ncbi:MAG: glycerol-3-phosphate 1-O-acyltransferase PlsY [Candidatus Omnitrophica bacterium]|nr:glycerol-3-phosphate 1-O-acyltransferase PlsY [Candidatus Omnitrophota bacterium]MDD5354998.1 glycerol-3-phosphate 1-O-acyltransferase PlsY [Candidatus Omnitrophota bacterium]
MNIITALLSSYIIGSIPFAFLLAKFLKNTDLRKVGSGNIGATNLARALGYKIGSIGLLLDVAKGIIPVVYLANFTQQPPGISQDSLRLILGLASICGHNWTIFLNFKGGKGIATSLGVLIGLSLKNILIAKAVFILGLIWFITLFIWGYVSLASIIVSLSLPVFFYIFKLDKTLICFSIIISIFAILRHKSNIRRLLQHKENRFNIKSKIPFFK